MNTTYKQFNATVEQIADRKMGFLISTASVDRDGDTIDPKGWNLKNYEKNPVVLWAHDYSQPPIGKAINIQSTKDGLRAEVEFLPQGMNPFADMVHDMVKGGFLSATSVGFAGTDFEKSKDRERGYDFKAQELLEFSIVPVPSNPEALIQRGLKNTQLQRYAKAMRHWTKVALGDDAPKLDAEQFDSLADAIAKAMQHEEKPDDKKDVKPEIDIQAIAAEVAKLLKPNTTQISTDVIDIQPTKGEIDWAAFVLPEAKRTVSIDAKTVDGMLLDGVKHAFREMAGASARAAINHMTGRLD
jgi:HK97 family phage prohead protease